MGIVSILDDNWNPILSVETKYSSLLTEYEYHSFTDEKDEQKFLNHLKKIINDNETEFEIKVFVINMLIASANTSEDTDDGRSAFDKFEYLTDIYCQRSIDNELEEIQFFEHLIKIIDDQETSFDSRMWVLNTITSNIKPKKIGFAICYKYVDCVC